MALIMLFAANAAVAGPEGHWEGRIDTPVAPLHVTVDLRRDDEGWRGTIDIPAQGAKGLPLYRIKVGHIDANATRVEFHIRDIPGSPVFKGSLESGVITGRFEQGGARLPFRLNREPSGPLRPQEPRPPFPYSSENVHFDNGPVSLAGTLTVPAGDGPFPAVLLISGSGVRDRDQTLFGHKPFGVRGVAC